MQQLTMHDYHHLAMRTSPRDGHDKICNGTLGLIGETGELVDIYKKFKFQSTADAQLPIARLADELGDTIWYLVELADGMDKELGEIVPNFAKLDGDAWSPSISPSLENTIVRMSRSANVIRREVERNRTQQLHAEMRHLIKLAARLGRLIGIRLSEIAHLNIEKLKMRYPDGFDAAISMKRYEV